MESKRGRPKGMKILHVETGKIYDTQGKAGLELGLSQAIVSAIIRGKYPCPPGKTLQKAPDSPMEAGGEPQDIS